MVVWLGHKDIKGLGLIYERGPACCKVDDLFLGKLPNSSEPALNIFGDLLNRLNGSIMGKNLVFNLLVPKVKLQ